MHDADMQRNIQHNVFGFSVNPNFLIRHVNLAGTALCFKEHILVRKSTVVHFRQDVYGGVHRRSSLVLATEGKVGGDNSIYI